MTDLTAPDREKLAKLLSMFGSDFDGERANAAAAAHKLVTKAGLTWDQIVAAKPIEHRVPLIGEWRRVCAELVKRPGCLNAWERTFVSDLPRFPRLSTKQRYILKTISDRVLGVAQ